MASPILSQAIPGLDRLTKSASSIIENALSGLPSPANARLENAWYGAGTGLDSRSGLLQNRGYDLYKREAQDQQQQGLNNLLKLISGYSGTVAMTPGQEQQGRQFQASFDRQSQLDAESRAEARLRRPRPTTPWWQNPSQNSDTSLPSSIGGYAPAGFKRYF